MKREGIKKQSKPLTHRVLWAATGPVAQEYTHLKAIIATDFRIIKATKKIVVGSSVAMFGPHAAEVPLNSHHSQYLSASSLSSYDFL